MSKIKYVPVTPSGSIISHLESHAQKEVWVKLINEASHMPYSGKQDFVDRGYTVEKTEWQEPF